MNNNFDDPRVRIHDWVMATFPLARKRQLANDDSLLESGIVDSLGTLEVVQYLEREFGIHVEDDEMLADHFDSVDAIAEFAIAKRSSMNEATTS